MRAGYVISRMLEIGGHCRPFLTAGILGSVHLASPNSAVAQTFNFPPPSAAPRPIQSGSPPQIAPATIQPTPIQTPPPAAQPSYPAAQTMQPSPLALAPESAAVSHDTTTPGIRQAFQPSLPPSRPMTAWPPAVLPYRDDMPIPAGYHFDSRVNSGLVLGGLAIWATPYITGLIAAAASGFAKGSGWLAVPVAGPFVAMGERTIDCSVIESSTTGSDDIGTIEKKCRESAIAEARVLALLTVDGLLQTTGAIMTIAGLMSPREFLLRSDIFPPDSQVSFDAGYRNGQFRLMARMQF